MLIKQLLLKESPIKKGGGGTTTHTHKPTNDQKKPKQKRYNWRVLSYIRLFPLQFMKPQASYYLVFRF